MRKHLVGRLVLVVLVAGVLAGCGEDNKVGDESLLNFQEQAGQRLGETTTTTAPPTTVTTARGAQVPGTQPGASGTPKATATTSPPTTRPPATATTATTATTAPKAQAATLEIFINSDGSSDPPLDPQTAQVYAGSIVRWTNKDAVPRSVQAVNGAFRSPAIAPGASYDWTAGRVGLFEYGDSTRPYVNATLEVLEKP